MKSKIIFIQTLAALAMTVALAPVVPGVASAAVGAPAQTEDGDCGSADAFSLTHPGPLAAGTHPGSLP